MYRQPLQKLFDDSGIDIIFVRKSLDRLSISDLNQNLRNTYPRTPEHWNATTDILIHNNCPVQESTTHREACSNYLFIIKQFRIIEADTPHAFVRFRSHGLDLLQFISLKQFVGPVLKS